MNCKLAVLLFLTGMYLWALPACSVFVKKPGDAVFTAIPGYPLNGDITCVLNSERIAYTMISWEQASHTGEIQPKTIAGNRTIYPIFSKTYVFVNYDPLDYSITMKVVPSDELNVRCYVIVSGAISYSSWSNITYAAPPAYGFPICEVGYNQGGVQEGSPVRLICESRGATPAADLKWYNGTSSHVPSDTMPTNGGNVSIATVAMSKYDNWVLFYCTATNKATVILGTTPNCSVAIEVLYKPYITEFTFDEPTAHEDTWTITCIVDSNPPSTIILFDMSSDTSLVLATNDDGKNDIRHIMASGSCSRKTRLKCLALNTVGKAETNASFEEWCQSRKTKPAGHCCTSDSSQSTPKLQVSSTTDDKSTRHTNTEHVHTDPSGGNMQLPGETGQSRNTKSEGKCCVGETTPELQFAVVTDDNYPKTDIKHIDQDVRAQAKPTEDSETKNNYAMIVNNVITIIKVLTLIAVFAISWHCCKRRQFCRKASRTLPELTLTEALSQPPLEQMADNARTSAVESREVNRPEDIHMTVLSGVLIPPLTPPANVGSSSESNLSDTYNTPKPYYVNQHMVKPVYTDLCSELDDTRRQSPMNGDYEEIQTDE